MRRVVILLAGLTFAEPALAVDDAVGGASQAVADRVAGQWRASGAEVARAPTRFLFDDDVQRIPLALPAGTGCVQVAIVGARGLTFRARLEAQGVDALDPAARAASVAGVLELKRCDARPVKAVLVASDAGRGAIEIIVARTKTPLSPLGTIVPERTGGALPPMPEAGALPAVAPLEKRVQASEARAKHEGAASTTRTKLHADDDGNGEGEVAVGEGCHRIEVIAREPKPPSRRVRFDVDAELKDGEHVLVRDRTETPDARLEVCVGKATRLTLDFTGAPPGADVVAALATWPVPARLPSLWGPVTRSRMARAMFIRHAAVPKDDPVFLAQGSSGATPVVVPVETGGCYVAVVGMTHGHPRQLQLRAVVGTTESTDERGAAEDAALSAFCVDPTADGRAKLDVTARGTSVGWALAVFRVRSGIWETGP